MHTYNTRHNNAFPLPRTRTSLYASYFLPSTLKLWNSLLPEIKDCPSLSILKSRPTSRVDHDKVPKYYYYGPRLTQILHAHLRMRSSFLNEHLYIKNIIQDYSGQYKNRQIINNKLLLIVLFGKCTNCTATAWR